MSEFAEENYVEEDYRMVETSSQPNPKGNNNNTPNVLNPQHFLGNMFLGEGFKPVYKPRGSPTTASTSSGSLFTIDSILAPRPKPLSPQRPVIHHPSLHLGHIAAAASGFGATSADFLGKSILKRNKSSNYYCKCKSATNTLYYYRGIISGFAQG